MKLIIDSSILIDYLRGGTKWQDFLNEVPRNAELFLPVIVIFELFSGKSTKKASVTKQISNLLKQFAYIELSETIAIKAGQLSRDIGSHIDPTDYIIAASALDIGGTVVTLNKKHFEQIPGLDLFDLP
jgi:predicted nucleic acid-binding protein